MLEPAPASIPEPDPYHELLASKLPEWLVTARPEHRQLMRDAARQQDPQLQRACQEHPTVARALVRTYGEHLQAEAALKALLASVPELRQYASGLLEAAISKRFDLVVDVSQTYLMNQGRAAAIRNSISSLGEDPFARSSRALKLATQSLLHSALQNFEAFEAQPGGMTAGGTPSGILDSNDVSLVSRAKRLAINPEEFAALARELDIGGKYQALLDALDPPAEHPGDEAVRAVFSAAERCTFALHVHHALLLGKIDKPLHDTLITLDRDGKAEHDGRALLCAGIELLHAPLTGAMAIGVDARVPVGAGRFPNGPVFPYDGWLVLYLPGLPEPLTCHASRAAAEAFLLKQLPALRRPECLRLIADRHRQGFLDKLADTLEPYTWSPRGRFKERIPDPDARISLHVQPFTAPSLDTRVSQRQQRLRDDGLFHAVPTATQDGQTAQRHMAYFQAISLDALNIAGLFIPPLGAVMLGITALQLANEAFEGIGSWLEGERQQAFDYLLDVLENVATMAALAAVHAGGGRPVVERVPVETPSFIEELAPVELPSGERRLWRPDLAPFAHDKVLPAGLKPDESGLLHHDGKTWLPVESRVFSVRRVGSGHRLEHPTAVQGYQPMALHNGAGAWLLETEQPLTWSGTQLLRRMGHLSTSFDTPALQRILAISGIDEAVLRRTLVENRPLPALLRDTLQRFKLDQDLRSTESDLRARREAFDRHYEQLNSVHGAGGESLRLRYPKLPLPVIDELLRHADGPTLHALGEGRIAPRLAEEVRAQQQQVRLARAYEGLHLDAVRSWDADRLALHTLGQLPGWPADLVIDLEQHHPLPADSLRTGLASGEPYASILSTEQGYLVIGGNAADGTQPLHDALHSALAAALPASAGMGDGAALKRLLQTRPLLPRAQLRQLLRMQPVRPGYRSPMRLADGRPGYPMGGGNPARHFIRRPTLIRMINQLGLPQHSSQGAADILNALERRGLSVAQINDHLLRLVRERNTLSHYLDAWQNALPGAAGPAEAIGALREQLMQCWYDHAPPFETTQQPVLRLEHLLLDLFPGNLPRFFGERVTRLELIAHTYDNTLGVQRRTRSLARLLEQFPGLRSLEISHPTEAEPTSVRAPHDALRSIADNLPALESLNLANQNLILSNQSFERLRGMQRLRRLTLDGNRISPYAREVFGRLGLDYLSLERLSLDSWPRSLNQRALGQIAEVSLRHNQIRTLPGFLIGNEQSTLPHTLLSLEGNDLVDDQLLRILLSHESSPERIRFDRSAALSAQMQRYTEQRAQLHEASHGWATAAPSPSAMAMRNRIAMTLNTYWRGVELGSRSPLRLDNIALEHFPPRLPDFFYPPVRALSMERTSSTVEQLDAFLRRFGAVEVLSLGNHAQPSPALAPTLLHLPRLSYLSLHEMGLEVDNDLLDLFGQLGNLRTLELNGNRQGRITQVPPALHNLSRLNLSNMNLSQWPTWVDSLLPLELLDLSDNQLTELPEHILNNPDTQAQVTSISLFDNPLTPQTVERARRSSATQRRFTFAFSPPADAPAGGHLHDPIPVASEDRPDLHRWLLGTPEQNEALRDVWQQLKQAGDARNLLTFVGRLQQSAPFRNGSTRAAFAERVRMVLTRALVDLEDRTLFEHIAQEGLIQPDTGDQTCHDGVLLVFHNLEFLIAGQRMLAESADTEQALYQELRRLYRLNRVDELARDNAGDRDEAEVRLAYRRGSNDSLKLGVPHDNMLFEAIAEVSRVELTRVIEQVRQEQQGDNFLEYAANNEQWCRYLRTTHAARFERIEQAYQVSVVDLPDQHPEGIRIEDLAPEYEALQSQKTEQERQLVRELTLLANPDSL
ncbi:NEL-type E3 ubiquitin ligase domain-containing protein [Pseudomonas sp. NPDC089401]|uniref:NEL-type E3 ubiquitin ligase domain-containing protein n=1 Tax=Pseudomonas sp. NPDC089401 TaxID=3364462 RepID=UPI003801F073